MSRSFRKRSSPVASKSSDTASPARHHSASRAVPGLVHDVLRSPGEPLSSPVRSQMESKFGKDFSQVRVHTDGAAAEASSSLGARAFTAGREIAFGEGQYQPETGAGQALIAHELTHVLQQGASTEPPTKVGKDSDPAEQQARRASLSVALGGNMAMAPSSVPPSVQCETEGKKPKLKLDDADLLKLFPPPLVKAAKRQPVEERATGGAAETVKALDKEAEQQAEKREGALEQVDRSLSGEEAPAGSTAEGTARKVGQKGLNKALELILPTGVGVEIDLKGGAKATLDLLKIIEAARKRKKKKEENKTKAEQR